MVGCCLEVILQFLTSPFPRTIAYGNPVPLRSLESNSTERSLAKRAEYLSAAPNHSNRSNSSSINDTNSIGERYTNLDISIAASGEHLRKHEAIAQNTFCAVTGNRHTVEQV